MASKIPEEIWKKLIGTEGTKYTNRPNDRGGETKFGISKNANPDVDVKNLTEEEARKIYTERYWNKLPEDKQDWNHFSAIVHTGRYDVPQDELMEKYLGIIEKHPVQRENLNGWMNRAVGEERFGKNKIDLRQLDVSDIRELVQPKVPEVPEVPEETEEASAFNTQPSTEPELDSSEQELSEFEDSVYSQDPLESGMEEELEELEVQGDEEEKSIEELEQVYAQDPLESYQIDSEQPQASEDADPFEAYALENEDPFESYSKDKEMEAASPIEEPKKSITERMEEEQPEFEMGGPYGDMISEAVDMTPEEQKAQVKELGAGVIGAADTATFGFSDEIAGKILGPEAEATIKASVKEAQEQSPAMFMLGSIIGGIGMGSPIAAGGNMARGVLGLAKAGKAVGRLQTAARVGSIGAVEGQLYGTGSSDKTLRDDPIGLLKDGLADAFIGGSFGGFLGGAIGGGVKAAKKAKPKGKGSFTEPKDFDEVLEIVGEEQMDTVINRAQKRAAKDYEKNLQTLTLIEDVTKKPQLQELLSTKGDLRAKVSKWEDYVIDSKKFVDKAEPSDLPASLAKLVKDDPELAESIYAYSNWRNEVLGYTRWLADADKGRRGLKEFYDELQGQTQPFSRNLLEQLEILDKSGRVNAGTYNLYKMQQNIADEFYNAQQMRQAEALIQSDITDMGEANKLAKQIIQENMVNDPMNKLSQKIVNTHVVAEIVDAKAGTDMQEIVYKFQQARNMKTGWNAVIQDAHRKAVKLRKGMKGEDIVELIESGKKHPVADAYREVFKTIRENANKMGVKIEEYGLGQNRYVKLKKKSGPDLIRAFEKQWEEVQDLLPTIDGVSDIKTQKVKSRLKRAVRLRKELRDLNQELTDIRSGDQFYLLTGKERPSQQEVQMIEDAAKGIKKEIQGLIGDDAHEALDKVDEFKNYLEKHLDRTITDEKSLRKAMADIREEASINRSIDPDVSAIFKRSGKLPTWLRETNIDKLIQFNMEEVSNAVFYQPLADMIDARTPYLKAIGMDDMAEYFNKFRGDVMGRGRSGIKEAFQRKSTQLELALGDSDMGKFVLGASNYMKSALYPNFLGLNPAAVLRNLTQPLTMTLPELGIEHTFTLARNMKDVMKMRLLDPVAFNKERERLSDLGILSRRDLKPEDMEGIKAGFKEYYGDSDLARHADEFIDKWNNTVMIGYSMSDTVNRMATARTVENIVDQLFAGKASAMRTVKNTPKGVQRSIQSALDSGLGKNSIKEIMMRHYDVQTQLAYGKVDMHELGRDLGPLFTMLTKWPITAYGDVYKKIKLEKGKGMGKAAKKYLAVWGTLMMADYITGDAQEDSPLMRTMIGTRGFSAWAPANSMVGNPLQLFLPVPVISGVTEMGASVAETAVKAARGKLTDRDVKKLGKTVRRGVEQYIPVAGSASRLIDRVEKLNE